MFAWILSKLFPPVLPGYVRDWGEREEFWPHEEGSAGPARRKKYRDGIERYFAENSQPIPTRYLASSRAMNAQLRYAEIQIAAIEKDLIAQGYVNTIHDCWEKEETE
jgi:hypothetical protein